MKFMCMYTIFINHFDNILLYMLEIIIHSHSVDHHFSYSDMVDNFMRDTPMYD